MTASVQYTVCYFQMRGRAELIRTIFEYAGVKYENKYPVDWKAEKESAPFGQLPVLIIKDTTTGKEETIAQTHAIVRYLATLFGLTPSDPILAAKVDMVGESLDEYAQTVLGWYFQPPAGEEAKQAAKVQIVKETVPAFIKYQNKLLAANGNNGYYFGTETTMADIGLFALVANWNTKFPEAFDREQMPELYKVCDRVAKIPRIAEYLESPRLHAL
ncbi:glutathione S-transferase [Blastocladiella britannica]|nr:glutathione S-transferase [Blastocladiella britannica]